MQVKVRACIVGILTALVMSAPAAFSDARNLLQNGDFSKTRDACPLEWGLGPGGTSSVAGPRGERCLKIASSVFQYSVANQYVRIDGGRVRRVRLGGMTRYKGIRRGAHDYDALRAFIIWYDARGRQVGNYADACQYTGSSNWRVFDAEFAVPKRARRAQVIVGLHECTGVCYFAHVRLTVTKGDMNFDPTTYAQTDASGWWAYTAKEVPAAGSPVDVSYLLDAPAGKHGFLRALDGHFYFDDGVRARFWGFDIMGEQCFPEHATAVTLASRLARMGVNMVRLHHLDASWAEPNIFDQDFDDTQHLSATSLDKLDYFVFQLKKRGIYIYLDWLVNRHFEPGDKVRDYKLIDDGAKIVSHLDPRIIELQKDYMRRLLSHRNAYSRVRYADEPQIALSEVVNEDSLFYEDWYDRVPPSYLKELQALCRKYEPTADPARHPFDAATIRALYRIESDFYRTMRAYLRKLGLRCPTTGSNHWENMGPALLCDSETDYIDRHYYWDHPKDGYGWIQEFDNLPMLAHYEDSIVPRVASSRVSGKPLVMTEWGFCWVNDFIAEGPLIGATYACLQDWDAMIWFDISKASPCSAMENEFDISNKPHLFSQWAAAALAFHRRDISPLTQCDQRSVSKVKLLQGKPLSDEDKIDALGKRIETRITDTPNAASNRAPTVSGAVEAVWNQDNGTLMVRTPRTVAFDGFTSRPDDYDLGWAKITVTSDFSALWFTSLDSLPLADSKRILITAVSRAMNTGQRFNAGRTHLVSPGVAPILIQPVLATIEFAEDVTVRPLAQDGKPLAPVTTRRIDTGKEQTFWWEVTR